MKNHGRWKWEHGRRSQSVCGHGKSKAACRLLAAGLSACLVVLETGTALAARPDGAGAFLAGAQSDGAGAFLARMQPDAARTFSAGAQSDTVGAFSAGEQSDTARAFFAATPSNAASLFARKTSSNAAGSFVRATPSDAAPGIFVPTASNALLFARSAGFWDNWAGDLSFLDGKTGKGTEDEPYQISTKAQLMGLSRLAADGMQVAEGEGNSPGDYSGAYFLLTRNIDLGGMEWLPIGFYKDSAELASGQITPFCGHFDGNGKTISNFRIYEPSWTETGLFGAIQDSEIRNLTVKPESVLTSQKTAGILAGRVENSRICDVSVSGTLMVSGTAGGIAAVVSDGSVLENCTADHIAIDAGKEKETYVGGIAGTAAASLIADCTVNTGDSLSARLQGGGYVGGIMGFQNGTDIFNTHVMGTIGGSGSQAIGGITGKYASGKLKVARFEGTIASSGLGSAAREGTFIGTRDAGFHFRYGTEAGADVAYLFADKESKVLAGVCGSGISDDNSYTYGAHIGFWHSGDNFFTLVQESGSRTEEEIYFYEELENGVLHVIDMEDEAREEKYQPDHFAPNAVGRPQRGYLVSVLQIDTAANVQKYYDVAVLTAKGSSAYSHELDKFHRGAVAAGDVVTVVTAPKNTDTEKYQIDGVPTYTDPDGKKRNTSYQNGGFYTFVMPECDTEVSAVYRKVAAAVRTEPEEYQFQVVQERSGDRKNPSTVTEVRNGAGKLIARYINGELEQDTKVQEVRIEAVVDVNNDVADSRVAWSIDDAELIELKKNDDEDPEGYTGKSASIELNLKSKFFEDIISKAEEAQREDGYRYAIPDTIYGGGIAVLTAKTRPAASFEGKPLEANCRILVTFRILDKTQVAAEGASLDKTELAFTVTRRLSGDRKNPSEQLLVSEPQTLTASFNPDFFDKKSVSWTSSDETIFTVSGDESGRDYKNVSVQAIRDAKWIRDLIAAENGIHENDPYRKLDGKGSRSGTVTVTADDLLGNRQSAVCEVTVNFVTEDQTVIRPEEVRLDQNKLVMEIQEEKSGDIDSETVKWTGLAMELPGAEVLPALENAGIYEPFNRKIVWNSQDPSLRIEDGRLAADPEAAWIKEAKKNPPYHGEKTVTVTAQAAGNPEALAECQVTLVYDAKCLEIRNGAVFDLVLTKSGRRSAPVLTWSGAEKQTLAAEIYPHDEKEAELTWSGDSELILLEESGAVTPNLEAEWIKEAMKKAPYEAEMRTAVRAEAGGMSDETEVLIKFRLVDNTYSSGSGSSGGSGGSSSSGSSSHGVTTGGAVNMTVDQPKGSVTGTWIQDGAGKWLFVSGGRTYAGEWAYVHNPYAGDGQASTDWFLFGQDGYMVTGWYQEPETGNWFYLHEISDGTLGHMYCGWHFMDGSWYYFNQVSDGTKGRRLTGWNWIDGKCYYFDPSDGRMAVSEMTPDGFSVDDTGAWTVDGIVQIRQDGV